MTAAGQDPRDLYRTPAERARARATTQPAAAPKWVVTELAAEPRHATTKGKSPRPFLQLRVRGLGLVQCFNPDLFDRLVFAWHDRRRVGLLVASQAGSGPDARRWLHCEDVELKGMPKEPPKEGKP